MLFFALCAAEAALLPLLLSLYRADTKADFLSFLFSVPGIIGFCALILLTSSVIWIVYTLRQEEPSKRKHLLMAAGMNVMMLVLTLGSVELLSRLLSKSTDKGEAVHGVDLYPRMWATVLAKQRNALEEAARRGSYLVHDRFLGWTVAPSYDDGTGQELSSSEGLRSPRAGVSFADLRTRHSHDGEKPASVRIALIGDSMTFGYEVRCEESWGHALETLLQPVTQVLNFSVSAYGLNQVLLRYEKDVRPWHPQIVVIGMTTEMVRRVNNIYPVLMNPEWGGFPYVRPRLVRKNDVLLPVNGPLPDPERFLDYSAIQELPHLDLDDYYRPSKWERGGIWSLLEKSYAFRFANSIRPPGDSRDADTVQHAIQSSQTVIQRLIQEVRDDGSIPLVVYLPYQSELSGSGNSIDRAVPISSRTLRNANIAYHDTTTCLIKAGVPAAYAEGGHYSPRGNAEIARCLEPVLQAEIQRLSEGANLIDARSIARPNQRDLGLR